MFTAKELNSGYRLDIKKAAEMVMEGGVVAFPFKSIFALVGKIDDPGVAEKIYEAKNRPLDKKLVAIYLPEYIDEIADFRRMSFSKEQLIGIWNDVHAVGFILPSLIDAPAHLVVTEGQQSTILSIYTEYFPLRYLLEDIRNLGGRGLVGTSANKSGQSTHWNYQELYEEFHDSVEGIVVADFCHFSEVRRKSTSVVDLTGLTPRLHREGNVPEDELRSIFNKYNLDLYKNEDVIVVQGRADSMLQKTT